MQFLPTPIFAIFITPKLIQVILTIDMLTFTIAIIIPIELVTFVQITIVRMILVHVFFCLPDTWAIEIMLLIVIVMLFVFDYWIVVFDDRIWIAVWLTWDIVRIRVGVVVWRVIAVFDDWGFDDIMAVVVAVEIADAGVIQVFAVFGWTAITLVLNYFDYFAFHVLKITFKLVSIPPV